MLKIAKDLFDLIYPIGTYYEISDGNWTPSSAGWYGTWVQDTKDQTTVSKGDSGIFATLGANVGAETQSIPNHCLTQSEMPVTVPLVRIVGSGEWSCGIWGNNGSGGYGINLPGQYGTSGQGQSHGHGSISIVQKSKVVIRWHRIA